MNKRQRKKRDKRLEASGWTAYVYRPTSWPLGYESEEAYLRASREEQQYTDAWFQELVARSEKNHY